MVTSARFNVLQQPAPCAIEHAKELHQILVEHLEHLGIDEELLGPLRLELNKRREHAEGSILYQLYLYAAEGLLNLALSNMSGSSVRLNVGVSTTGRELKGMYAANAFVPVREQQLVYKGQVLPDGDALAVHHVSPFEPHITVVRVRPPKLYVLGGLADEKALSSVEVLDTADHTWETLPSMLSERGGSFGTAVIDNRLYVLGGQASGEDSEGLASAEVYDPALGYWNLLPPMMTCRHNFVTAVVGGKLYAIGGDDGTEALACGEVYQPGSSVWEWIPPMPTARFYAQSAVIGDKIYVVGGDDGQTAFASLEVFDTATSTWQIMESMATPRFGFQVAVSDGKLFAIGGYDGSEALASTEVFDPETGRWQALLPMWNVRSRSACAVVDGRVIAIGGYMAEEGHAESSAEAYDGDIGAWIPMPPMHAPRFDSTSITVNRKLYMFGGDVCDGAGANATAEFFDNEAQSWVQLPPMKEARRSAQVVVIDT